MIRAGHLCHCWSMLAVFLLACGGRPGTLTDTTPPAIASRTPAASATNVWARDPIQVVFSEPVAPESVNDASVLLASGGSVAVAKTVELASDGRTLTISPVAPVEVPNTLHLTLTNAIRDQAGNAFAGDSWSWDLPKWVQLGSSLNTSPDQAPAYNPSVVLDANDRPIVAFHDYQAVPLVGSKGIVKRWSGTTWEQLGDVVDVTPNWSAKAVSLAMTTGGQLFALWGEAADDGSYQTSSSIYVRQFGSGAWSSVLGGGYLNDNPGANGGYPARMALDGSGHPVVAWSQGPAPFNVHVKSWNGTGWVAVGGGLAADVTATASVTAIAIGKDGAPLVALHQHVAGSVPEQVVLYIRHWNASSQLWEKLGANGVNEDPAGWADWASLAVDSAGRPVLAWVEYSTSGASAGQSELWVKRWENGTWNDFGSGSSLKAAGAYEVRCPTLALDANDRPIVAWDERATASGPALAHVSRWSGSSWESMGTLNVDPANSAAFSSLALDSRGSPVVTWYEAPQMAAPSAPPARVYVKRYNR